MSSARPVWPAPLLPALLLAACAAPLDDNSALIVDERLLAVVARPAEVAPGATQSLTGLWAGPDGLQADAALGWGVCRRPKPLAELGPASPDCLEAESASLDPLADGPTATLVVPEDACSLFGPNPPPPVEGEEPGRPADPDITGGFYQPVAVFGPGAQEGEAAAGIASTRLRCGLANVSQETYIAWNEGYHDNLAPEIEALELRVDGDPVPVQREGDAATATVPAGAAVALELRWPECPLEAACGDGVCSGGETAAACAEDCGATGDRCAGAEAYVVQVPGTDALELAREAVSVAWFTTGGALDAPRAGRAEDDAARTVEGRWTAPSSPGDELLVAVLRDSRGGISALSLTLTVD
jgi:hypothetical protein